MKAEVEKDDKFKVKYIEKQGDHGYAREITAVWCLNVKNTKFCDGYLGSLAAILYWQWVLEKPVLYNIWYRAVSRGGALGARAPPWGERGPRAEGKKKRKKRKKGKKEKNKKRRKNKKK